MSERKNKPKKFRKRSQDLSSTTSSSSESTSSLSSDDESNNLDLKPMKEYLMDRRELARQLFIAVKSDKLRMMLPQVLKKMELSELEEWCANELSGMSRARIISILSGQPMLHSSDSNDSEDSGPSLEIISDTEEWGDMSDVDVGAKDLETSKTQKARSKSRPEKLGGKDKGKTTRAKVKSKVKLEVEPKPQKSESEIRVKKETDQEQGKEKDGESLLDLLELEMRARAIRALIRKEEDIIPTATTTSVAQSSALNLNPQSTVSNMSKMRAKNRSMSLKAVQDKLQELDSSFRQAEKNKATTKGGPEISEEEDVVLVLEPTTTIELLSSGSDDESGQGNRRNQRLENERFSDRLTSAGNGGEKNTEQSGSNVVIGGESKAPSLLDSGSSGPRQVLGQPGDALRESSSGKEKLVDESPKDTPDFEIFRKLKNNPQSNTTETNSTTVSNEKSPGFESKNKSSTESINDAASSATKDLPDSEKDPDERTENVRNNKSEEASGKIMKVESSNDKSELDDDKLTDSEILIDLDDYPDDIEGLESKDKNPKAEMKKVILPSNKEEASQSAETWATRYYQTDDVQSVIKESKMQSEIRKRLRERQRLARLNNSPGSNLVQNASLTTPATTSPANSTSEKFAKEKAEESPTTGSVGEYLALKNAGTTAKESAENTVTTDKQINLEKPETGSVSEVTKSTKDDQTLDAEEKVV